jgi:hypothetical protein
VWAVEVELLAEAIEPLPIRPDRTRWGLTTRSAGPAVRCFYLANAGGGGAVNLVSLVRNRHDDASPHAVG